MKKRPVAELAAEKAAAAAREKRQKQREKADAAKQAALAAEHAAAAFQCCPPINPETGMYEWMLCSGGAALTPESHGLGL